MIHVQLKYAVGSGRSLSDAMIYGEKYTEDNVQLLTWSDGHPFMFLAWIGNTTASSFSLQVRKFNCPLYSLNTTTTEIKLTHYAGLFVVIHMFDCVQRQSDGMLYIL